MSREELAKALDRYRGLIDEWPAFLDALQAPHVPSVWINRDRMDPARAVAAMSAEGMRPEPIAWRPGAYRVRPEDGRARRVGGSWLYQAGLYQVQEESSMVPVHLLAPEPGERVLDLCAAPGNKTAQIAMALGGRGTVIANDRNRHRLAALHNTVSRLGLRNVTMTATDGCQFPMQPTLFDRVLVDAPCTAEGTARKHRRAGERERGFGRYISGIQRALLRRALLLTRPGGRVVYSTCTFAPEENEMVIDAVLNAHPDAARVLPVESLPGLPFGSGVTEWNGRRLAPQLAGCVRMWPHLTGTGGFFAAVLERTDAPLPAPPNARLRARSTAASLESHAENSQADISPWCSALEHKSVLACCSRYGMDPDLFAHLLVGQRGRYLRITADDHQLPVGLTIVASGLPSMPSKAAQPRFTTAGVLAFGAHAQRRVIDLTARQSARYLRREEQALHVGSADDDDRGFAIVRRLGEVALGNAQLVAKDGSRIVVSCFPKAWLRGPRGA